MTAALASLRTWLLSKIRGPMNFIYLFISIIQAFFFFFKWIRKVKFFFYRYRCIGFNLKVEFESYTLETTIFNGELFKVENLHFLSVWKKNIGAVIWFLLIWNV